MERNIRGDDPVLRLSRIDTRFLPADGGPDFNRLIFEKSPYLLQHADNPIDWYPWGEEAFSRARADGKPVFVSIGYSTCHWCHVMAHESFEDEEVARILNRDFVCIKIDREERPDVDAIYMTVCQMMTGGGGWPLNLLLTPDRKPFFAATYLPTTSQRGMPGFIPLLKKVAEMWQSDRDRLVQSGNEVESALKHLLREEYAQGDLRDAPLRGAYEDFLESFDRHHGGFGDAPKFPTPHNLSLLLRYAERSGEEQARTMALRTLQGMRLGGIYDHLGFGLHRYSVDARWLVPHFEKMLYDQALTAMAFLDAYQVSGDYFFGQSAREILEYVQRDLAAPDGGFCCGEDADSEGEEGTFYVWRPEQIKEALGAELAAVFCRSYGITEEGNFEGRSIPHLSEDLESLAQKAGVKLDDLTALLAEARARLFEARNTRIRPHRDDKIITGWNGLIIAALARAAAIFGDREPLEAASAAAQFILKTMRTPEGRLLRRYRAGDAAIPAFLEDYAFFIWGLIEIYLADFDTSVLKTALELTEEMERLFGDPQGGYFDSGTDAETVLVRGKSAQDGALPSGNSVAALNLYRLADLTGNAELEARAERLLRANLPQVERYPSAFTQMLIALDYALGPREQIVFVAGQDGRPPDELLQVARQIFLPRTVVALHRPEDVELKELSSIVEGKENMEGRAAAYLCRERSCRGAVTTAGELRDLLTR
jgi:uncharacterized protein